jgi:hypothetical protein
MLRNLDPAKDSLADNEEIQVNVPFSLDLISPYRHAGIIPSKHVSQTQDSEADRQVQPEERLASSCRHRRTLIRTS